LSCVEKNCGCSGCPAAGTSSFSRSISGTRKRPAAFEPLTDIRHIAYTAIHEKPELVAGWSSKEQIETNNAMLRNVVEPIVRTASDFQHISILQGTKVYGVHLHPIPIPAREPEVTERPGVCSAASGTALIRSRTCPASLQAARK
jgi:hypothetical protein